MTGRRRELLVLAGLLLGLGVALGVVWFAVAPTPEYVVRADGLYFASTQPGEFIAMDGWFAALSLVAGALAGVHVARRGRVSVAALLVLAAGGVAGAWLAWQIGVLLGPEAVTSAEGEPVGTTVPGPLDLNALGVLAVWPVTSLVVVLLALAWGSADDDEEEASVPADGERGDVDRGQ